jgi:signal transduction histidine kinase
MTCICDSLENVDMIHPGKIESNAIWSKDIEHLVPKITSSILDGVRSCDIEEDTEHKLFRHNKLYNPNAMPLNVPVRYPSNRQSSDKREYKAVSDFRKIFVIHHNQDHRQIVRSFIGGLSHCYNNLLMGIWGNASLIGMTVENDHPLQSHLGQIEALIQDGSNLIHLLFGYIVERRMAAKKLRLKQLIQEIKSYNHISGNEIDFSIIETSIISLSKIRDRVQLAACISPVINQLLTLVQQKRSLMEPHCQGLLKAKMHLEKMDELLTRGFEMIQDLDFYAAAIKPRKKNINLKSIIRNYVDDIVVKRRNVIVTHDLSSSIPRIYVDPKQITHALKQLVDNAMDAVDENGDIHLQVNTLNSENPHERICAHTSNNYVVITVSDRGQGMAIQTQAKIFDPFFIGHNERRKMGLGLAAAAGIVKSHGGYIQVRSTPGMGSIFKVYLPI